MRKRDEESKSKAGTKTCKALYLPEGDDNSDAKAAQMIEQLRTNFANAEAETFQNGYAVSSSEKETHRLKACVERTETMAKDAKEKNHCEMRLQTCEEMLNEALRNFQKMRNFQKFQIFLKFSKIFSRNKFI